MTGEPTCGAVYVVQGEACAREAAFSARSLRRYSPNLPIVLITDTPVRSSAFDEVLVRRDMQRLNIEKTRAVEAPFDRVLYLDSDTYVVGDVRPAFRLLDSFDFAAVQNYARFIGDDPQVPDAFPQHNSGVIAFRNTAAVQKVFAEWRALFLNEPHRYDRGPADQHSLRRTLFHSSIRIANLPPVFNVTEWETSVLGSDARVLHGRPRERLLAMARELSSTPRPSVWLPHAGALPEPGPHDSRLFRKLAVRSLRHSLRAAASTFALKAGRLLRR